MVTLALVTPLGVFIGMIITEYVTSDSSSMLFVIGILQGLAGGTLLYITFFEVLDKEKLAKLGMGSLWGCFLIILGFGIMAGLEAAGMLIKIMLLNLYRVEQWILPVEFFSNFYTMVQDTSLKIGTDNPQVLSYDGIKAQNFD